MGWSDRKHSHVGAGAPAQRVSMLKSGRLLVASRTQSACRGRCGLGANGDRATGAGGLDGRARGQHDEGWYATADAGGDARLPFDLEARPARPKSTRWSDVDVCGEVRRVIVVDRNLAAAPPEAGCTRKDAVGCSGSVASTLVVSTEGVNATVFLRQGPVDLTDKGPTARWDSVPTAG